MRLDLELALHAINENVEVKLAHALDDRLARFMVGRDAEAGIFGGQAVERDAHAFLVGLGLGFDRQFDDRFRSEEHTSELQSLMRISYAVFCLKQKSATTNHKQSHK